MILKKAEYKRCECCGSVEKMVHDEIIGCDNCSKMLVGDHLSMNVFFKNEDVDNYEFCSWKCAIEKLKTIKTDYFIDLPMLVYENDTAPGMSFKDFLNLFE